MRLVNLFLTFSYHQVIKLLSPALSSFGEERENYFMERKPRAALVSLRLPWAIFFRAYSPFI
jgi:hypothetical protein